MDIQEKINFVKDKFDCESSLLLLNVDIEVFLEECREIAYHIKREKIESIYHKDVKDRIDIIVKRFRNKENYKKSDFYNLIQKYVYICCNDSEVLFAKENIQKKMKENSIGLRGYEEKVLNEIKEKINNNQIIFNTPYLKLNSYEVQYIKYMNKTKYSFESYYKILYSKYQNTYECNDNSKEDVLIKDKSLDKLYNKIKIKSIKDSHDFEINSEWFILSNIYSEFIHNLVITIELYLKMIIAAVDIESKTAEDEILTKLKKIGHSYTSLLDELEGKDNFTKNSRIGLNKNHIARQITNLNKYYKNILISLDECKILEQVRYGENTNTINISMMPTTNDILSLFVFLNSSYNELMKYRRLLDIDICEGFTIKDYVTIRITDTKNNITRIIEE